jgi:hypothetical protein
MESKQIVGNKRKQRPTAKPVSKPKAKVPRVKVAAPVPTPSEDVDTEPESDLDEKARKTLSKLKQRVNATQDKYDEATAVQDAAIKHFDTVKAEYSEAKPLHEALWTQMIGMCDTEKEHADALGGLIPRLQAEMEMLRAVDMQNKAVTAYLKANNAMNKAMGIQLLNIFG